MLQNCDMKVLLQQEKRNEQQAAELFDLSPAQQKLLRHPQPGQGILVTGRTAVPFSHRYPDNNIIYNTITTKFQDRQKELKDSNAT